MRLNVDLGDDRVLVNHWLKGLSRNTGLTLQLDESGVCAVGHISQLDCAVEVPANGSVYLRTPSMPWGSGMQPGLAERCLSAHFLGMHTDGASFAIDPDEAELVLWKQCALATLDEGDRPADHGFPGERRPLAK